METETAPSTYKCPADGGVLHWNRWSELECPQCDKRYFMDANGDEFPVINEIKIDDK